MLTAGVDKVHRDLILGHSLQGMDVHYMAPDDVTLKEAMEKYKDDEDFMEEIGKAAIEECNAMKGLQEVFGDVQIGDFMAR